MQRERGFSAAALLTDNAPHLHEQDPLASPCASTLLLAQVKRRG